jgi:hypothetical protein
LTVEIGCIGTSENDVFTGVIEARRGVDATGEDPPAIIRSDDRTRHLIAQGKVERQLYLTGRDIIGEAHGPLTSLSDAPVETDILSKLNHPLLELEWIETGGHADEATVAVALEGGVEGHGSGKVGRWEGGKVGRWEGGKVGRWG